MFNIKYALSRAFLAFVLAASTCTAFAGPTYHVSIDTRTLSGNAYLDMTLGALLGAAPVTATLSNFTGNFGSAAYFFGDVTGSVASAFTLSNTASFNEVMQAITFGGVFGFDAHFDVAAAGATGTTFGVALVNDAMTDYVSGTSGDFILIDLLPGFEPSIASATSLTSVNVVPEPSSTALFAAGMLLLVGVHRAVGGGTAKG